MKKFRHIKISKKGSIKNPYDKEVLNIGSVGNIDVKSNIYQYNIWRNILVRCYNKNIKEYKYYGGIGVNIYNEWLCFENFEKWFDENYYEIDNEIMCLDKDILKKGNKCYCPQYCCFVPMKINNLFIQHKNSRNNLPIGVRYRKDKNRYEARCNVNNNSKTLGEYKTKEEAFYSYKNFKENYIKQIADEYKDKIPQRLYDAMYKWKVEITD